MMVSLPIAESFRLLDADDLVDAPIEALLDISAEEARAFRLVLGVRTIRDLAANSIVRTVQSVTQLATVTSDAEEPANESAPKRVMTGQDWLDSGLFGLWADRGIDDPVEYVRRLRRLNEPLGTDE